MTQVSLGHSRGWLQAPAAASLVRLDRARGRPLRINSAGRTYAQQRALYRAYLAGTGNLALSPDAPSRHQIGMACDYHSAEYDFMRRVGHAHGWRFCIAGEPWHGEYRPELDRHAGAPASRVVRVQAQPEQDEDEEDEMRTFITESSAAVKYELLRGTKRAVGQAEWKALRALEGAGLQMAVAIVPRSVITAIPGA